MAGKFAADREYRPVLDGRRSKEEILRLLGSGDAPCMTDMNRSRDVGRRGFLKSPSRKPEDGLPRSGRPISVYVGNLPLSVDESLLDELFSKFGKIVNVHLPVCNGNMSYKYGFVRFELFESAHTAIKQMHNYDVHGNKLRVELASESQSGHSYRHRVENIARYHRGDGDQSVSPRSDLRQFRSEGRVLSPRFGLHDKTDGRIMSPRNGLRQYRTDERVLSLKLRESFTKLQQEHEQLMKELDTQPLSGRQQGKCMRLVLDLSEIADRVQQARHGLSDGIGSESKVPDIPDRKPLSRITPDKKQTTQSIQRPPTPIPATVLKKLHVLQPNWNLKPERKLMIGRGRLINNLTENMTGLQLKGSLKPIQEDKREYESSGKSSTDSTTIPGLGRGSLSSLQDTKIHS